MDFVKSLDEPVIWFYLQYFRSNPILEKLMNQSLISYSLFYKLFGHNGPIYILKF
jgi:hypothetical protein